MVERAEETTASARRYTPAAGYSWLTPLYDPVLALTMREQTFRSMLVERVSSVAPKTVLDLGCGTGSLAVLLARALPGATITGVDGDEQVLRRARKKIGRSDRRVSFRRALASDLPLDSESQDVVVSSLVFHHLAPREKVKALAETHRVLRPQGRLEIADWGRPQDVAMRAAFLAVQLLDGFETTRDHAAGRLPEMIDRAGFTEVTVSRRLRTVWGTLDLISARRR